MLHDRGIRRPTILLYLLLRVLAQVTSLRTSRFQVGSFVGNLAASSFFLRLLHAAGGAITFFLFAAIVFVVTVFIILVVQETKDKEPHSIAADLPECECCPTYTELTDKQAQVDDTPDEGTPLPDVRTENWI